MTLLEGGIVLNTIRAAKRAGYIHRKVVYQNRHGAPDDWFFGHGGDLIIVEHKRPGKSPEAHQEREIARLRTKGFKVYVVDSIDAGNALFRSKNRHGDNLA